MNRVEDITDEFFNPRVPRADDQTGDDGTQTMQAGDNGNGHVDASGNGHHETDWRDRHDTSGYPLSEADLDTQQHAAPEPVEWTEPETPETPQPEPEADTASEPTPDTVAEPEQDQGDGVVHVPQAESLPQLARAAAGAWLKAAGWTAGTSLRAGSQLRRIAADPNAAQDVLDEVTREVRGVAREFLGINELDQQVQQIAPLVGGGMLGRSSQSPEALRAQGDELLRAAADVDFDEGAHPALARILGELSPDEARILRLLAIEGPQPMVDIRATNLIGNGTQLIAQALNMLGPQAGVRHRDRVPVYLANLVRLNLIVLSDEALGGPALYQVLEAQPEVLGTLKDTARAKPIRRSVLLTPLGQELCHVCLPLHTPALPPASGGSDISAS